MSKTTLEISEETVLELQETNKSLRDEIFYLREQLEIFKKALFGKKSEKIIDTNDNQLHFEFDETDGNEVSEVTSETITYTRKKRKPTNKDTLEYPEDLPEQIIHVDLPEDEKICSITKKPLRRSGENVIRQLAMKPAEFYIKKYVLAKYVRDDSSEVAAKKPSGLFEVSKVDESVIADIITKKYSDHLPLYRISEIYSRSDIFVSRQLLSKWAVRIGQIFLPLYQAMLKKQKLAKAIFIDETPCNMLVKGLGRAHKAFVWVTADNDPGYQMYHFKETREQQHAYDILEDFEGVYHSDRYRPYENLASKEKLVWAPCFAHMRRKFFEIPQETDRKKRILELFGKLFGIEKTLKDLSDDEIVITRQQNSVPVIDELIKLTKEILSDPSVLPKSAIRKACNYFLAVEKHLKNYISNPLAKIDNNTAERAIRPLAIGRKNWLFMGSSNGGEAAVVLLSIVQTCRNLGINPFDYFDDVLRRIQDYPINRVMELAPDNWKKSVKYT